MRLVLAVGGAALLLIVGALAARQFAGQNTQAAAGFPVPDVVGLRSSDAIALLESMGFEQITTIELEADTEPGRVLGTSPSSGSLNEPDAPITLTVSKAPPEPEHPRKVGRPTVGLFDPVHSQWHLRSAEGVVTSFFFGAAGELPIVGDWNCDGVDSPGMYRQSDGLVYLRNSLSEGEAEHRFFLGNPGDIPIVGDFNGDGCDTVSIYRSTSAQFFIINALGSQDGSAPAPHTSFSFGNPGDQPIVGDFDNDGVDTIGVFRGTIGSVFIRNTNSAGPDDLSFSFGNPGDIAVIGDWGTPDGIDTVGLFRPGSRTFHFKHANRTGPADSSFEWGEAYWIPVAGHFDLPVGAAAPTATDVAMTDPRLVRDAVIDAMGRRDLVALRGLVWDTASYEVLAEIALNDNTQMFPEGRTDDCHPVPTTTCGFGFALAGAAAGRLSLEWTGTVWRVVDADVWWAMSQ